MANGRHPVRYGRIVFAWIEDRRGYAKLRPAIIVTRDDEITDDGPLVVVAVTTTFADPIPEFCVPLPWHAAGHPVTRLRSRSAAVVNWLATIVADDVAGYGGDAPAKTMRLIQSKLGTL